MEKDRKPNWKHRNVMDVEDEKIQSYFEPHDEIDDLYVEDW